MERKELFEKCQQIKALEKVLNKYTEISANNLNILYKE